MEVTFIIIQFQIEIEKKYVNRISRWLLNITDQEFTYRNQWRFNFSGEIISIVIICNHYRYKM